MRLCRTCAVIATVMWIGWGAYALSQAPAQNGDEYLLWHNAAAPGCPAKPQVPLLPETGKYDYRMDGKRGGSTA